MLSVYDQLMIMDYDQSALPSISDYPRVVSFLTLRGFFEGKIKPDPEFFNIKNTSLVWL
jgi:hypothetical protein